MTREEMKHIHKINEHLKGSGYQLGVNNDQITLHTEDCPCSAGTGSQDARRQFGDIAHHGHHHGRHRNLQALELAAKLEENLHEPPLEGSLLP